MPDLKRPILLFDGTCGLCDKAVSYVVKRDPGHIFRFAPMQGSTAHKLTTLHGLSSDIGESTMVLFEADRCYTHSRAVLEIWKRLGFPYSILYAGIVIPSFIRDSIYRYVARHRYQVFGRVSTCSIETSETAPLFLS